MAESAEDDILVLKEKNKALAERAQYWKMTAAQRAEENMELMRELNQLRLALSHYRASNSALDVALDSAVQEFGEQELTRLVEVSSSITRTVEFVKNYIRKKQEIDRSSSIGKPSLQDSPSSDRRSKVLRVVPMIRGRSIGKPIILLRPIDAEIRDLRQERREDTNQNEDTQSPPQQVMQDVYIPLRRIDAETLNSVNVRRRSRSYQPVEDESDTNADAGSPEQRLGASENTSDEENEDENDNVDSISDGEDTTNNRRNLETLLEVTESEKWSPTVMLQRSDLSKSRRSHSDDPLEGPSWLLDGQPQHARLPSEPQATTSSARRLEADSTTDNAVSADVTPIEPIAFSSPNVLPQGPSASESPTPAAVYTPTRRVRRRRRSRVSLALIDEGWAASPPLAASNVTLRRSRKNDKDPTKVVVMVAKMRADELENHRLSSQHPESATFSGSSSQHPESATHSGGSIQNPEYATHSPSPSQELQSTAHPRSSSRYPETATHSDSSHQHLDRATNYKSSSKLPETATRSTSSSKHPASIARSASSSKHPKSATHSRNSSQHSEAGTHSESLIQDRKSANNSRSSIVYPESATHSSSGQRQESGLHSRIFSQHQESAARSMSSSKHPKSATHSRSCSQQSEAGSNSGSSSQDLKSATHSKSSSQHPESAAHSRSGTQHQTPQRRNFKTPSFDAPSPNGSTRDAGPIIMESPDVFPKTKQETSREGSPVLQHPVPRAVKRASSSETSLDQLLRARRARTHSDRARSEETGQEGHKRQKKSEDRNISDRSHSLVDVSGRSGSSETHRPGSCEIGEHGIRPRRPRKGPQTYKEKPLNRKLRRQD